MSNSQQKWEFFPYLDHDEAVLSEHCIGKVSEALASADAKSKSSAIAPFILSMKI